MKVINLSSILTNFTETGGLLLGRVAVLFFESCKVGRAAGKYITAAREWNRWLVCVYSSNSYNLLFILLIFSYVCSTLLIYG